MRESSSELILITRRRETEQLDQPLPVFFFLLQPSTFLFFLFFQNLKILDFLIVTGNKVTSPLMQQPLLFSKTKELLKKALLILFNFVLGVNKPPPLTIRERYFRIDTFAVSSFNTLAATTRTIQFDA
jgi:hypothetical protein